MKPARITTGSRGELISRLEYIASRFVIEASGCWTWQKPERTGYGTIHVKGIGNARVHRYIYELIHGDISPWLHIDHLCRNRACCNPEHLEVVTPRVNQLRGTGAIGLNYAKTECINGHLFSDDNTYEVPGRPYPQRYCKACMNIANERQRRRKGIPLKFHEYCKRGHKYEPGNIYNAPGTTRRECLACVKYRNSQRPPLIKKGLVK